MIPMENEGPAPVNVARLFPGGAAPSVDEVAVAAVILGGLGILWAVRKGIRGLGPVELAGSTMSGLEFAGYLFVVGGTLRVIATRFPEHPIARAIAFVY